MLGLTPRRRRRVSNGLAIFGAFLLAASLLAGSGQVIQSADRQADAGRAQATTQSETADEVFQAAAGKTRKLRVSLFLFRN